MDIVNFPRVWRTKLRSVRPDPPVDHAAQVAHCLSSEVIGIGWGLDDLPTGTSAEVVIAAVETRAEKGWGRRGGGNLRRFAYDLKVGDFVWTRDLSGRYLVCRVTGPHRYDATAEAAAVDVYQVRDVEWSRPINDLDVPGGVVRNFVGQGATFVEIHDKGARALTAYLWEKLHGRPVPRIAASDDEVLQSYLDPWDVEDLVYVWLQASRGYVALPRSRNKSMPAYEYTLIHPNGRRAIAQIKTGGTEVDLAALRAAVADDATDTFAFATSGKYSGERSLVSHIIAQEELLTLVREKPTVIPPRVLAWFELAHSSRTD